MKSLCIFNVQTVLKIKQRALVNESYNDWNIRYDFPVLNEENFYF